MPSPTSAPRRWTTRELLQWTSGHFREKGVDSPRVCAEMLLAHVLGCERMRLYMEADRPAAPEELVRFRELVARAGRHEPVQYLVGHAWFFSRKLEVDASTLIPRPSTETVVETALVHFREHAIDAPRVLDLCTGSGCIAISIAAQLPGATIVATDVVPAALALAARNARAHNVATRIEFREGSLWEPIADDEPFDAICANPPYISDLEWDDVPPNVKHHEPASALRAGPDGLDLVRPTVGGASARLAPGGLLAVEIAASQEAASLRLARDSGLVDARVVRDFEGLPRVLRARRST
ncbi:MAG: peptide chain release factor N(5)-glutamine methyltransferase [Phycisphaerales bacterium]